MLLCHIYIIDSGISISPSPISMYIFHLYMIFFLLLPFGTRYHLNSGDYLMYRHLKKLYIYFLDRWDRLLLFVFVSSWHFNDRIKRKIFLWKSQMKYKLYVKWKYSFNTNYTNSNIYYQYLYHRILLYYT